MAQCLCVYTHLLAVLLDLLSSPLGCFISDIQVPSSCLFQLLVLTFSGHDLILCPPCWQFVSYHSRPPLIIFCPSPLLLSWFGPLALNWWILALDSKFFILMSRLIITIIFVKWPLITEFGKLQVIILPIFDS